MQGICRHGCWFQERCIVFGMMCLGGLCQRFIFACVCLCGVRVFMHSYHLHVCLRLRASVRVCVGVCAYVSARVCVCDAVLFTSIVAFHGSFPHPTSTSILNRMKTTLEKEDNHMFSDTKSLGEVTSM